jgi:hypothetical protein
MSLIEFEKILSSNTITIEKAKIDNELIRLENKFILDEYDKFKVLTREVLTKKFRVKTIIYPIKKKDNLIIISFTFIGGLSMLLIYLSILIMFLNTNIKTPIIFYFIPFIIIYLFTLFLSYGIREHLNFTNSFNKKI